MRWAALLDQNVMLHSPDPDYLLYTSHYRRGDPVHPIEALSMLDKKED